MSVVALGDTHHPWARRDAIAWAVRHIRRVKPKYVVQVGDLYDRYADTSFARSLNVLTPQREHELGRRDSEKMWEAIKEAAGPKCELIQLLGNHDDRPFKRALEKLPEQAHILEKGMKGFWEFDGVQTIVDSKEDLIIDGVLYTHGHFSFGDHIKKYRMPVVCGHLHKGAVIFERISIPRGNRLDHKIIWEANAGFLGDPMALPLRYRQMKRIYPYTLGLFHLDEYGPRFVPMGGQ